MLEISDLGLLRSQVSGHEGPESLEACLTGAEVVVIPAGVPRKPGISAFKFMSNALI